MRSHIVKENDFNRVIYIMSAAFRIRDNHTLDYAIQKSKQSNVDLEIIVLDKLENGRNDKFFINGTKDLVEKLSIFSNKVSRVSSLKGISLENSYVFKDKGYLKEERRIDDYLMKYDIGLEFVETNVLVPVQVASKKEEYAARTIRKKIWDKVLSYTDQVHSDVFTRGETEAYGKLQKFIDERLPFYTERNNPKHIVTSELSPYLKYGFISPLTIYVEICKLANSDNKEEFLDEVIIRRELAHNFIYYNSKYDEFDGITYDWAYETMENHIEDRRRYLYKLADYEQYKTHDIYFNTAMKEMIHFGTMHTYMRMYWAKKIIEWSQTYKEAYETAVYLNNKYFLDGNTPNGYTGVAWCFGKHDHGWKEREIFGKLRYMNDSGLKRKFNMNDYIDRVDRRLYEKA